MYVYVNLYGFPFSIYSMLYYEYFEYSRDSFLTDGKVSVGMRGGKE